MKFAHCQTPVVEYIGTAPLTPWSTMRSIEWLLADGTHPDPTSSRMVKCPDCGEAVTVERRALTEVK